VPVTGPCVCSIQAWVRFALHWFAAFNVTLRLHAGYVQAPSLGSLMETYERTLVAFSFPR
jgi:hypothetical protein